MSPEKKKKRSVHNTTKLLKWLWQTAKSYRLQAGLNALIGCSSVLLDFAFIWSTKLAIDIATGRTEGHLSTAGFLLTSIVVVQVLIGLGAKWIRALLGVKAQNTMQQKIFSSLLDSQWTALEKRHTGDMLNRLERDVTDVVQTITETFPGMIAVLFRLAGAFFFLYSMDSFLACITIIILPLFILLSKSYVRKMRCLTRDIRNTDSRIQSVLQETLQHRMVIKTLEQSRTMAGRLEQVQKQLRQQVKRQTVFSSFSATMLNIGFASCYLIAFLWGSARLQDGTITYGMMMAFIQLVGQIQSPFREMTRFIPVLISSLTATERLIELEEVPKENNGCPLRLTGSVGIRMTHVNFAYSEKERTILSDFSFDFRPGTSTAILGETGAGKTTLIRLILSLIQPQSGTICFYNHKSETICSPQTRCNLVYVPQGNTLFSGTIRDNLLLGNPQATEAEMKAALLDACADFVFENPEGLDARCGELGQGFSEGQAQRIAVARALLRKGGILLLDEATSALDPETEKRMLQNLTAHIQDKTMLFITHRPAIVSYCTQVLQLKRQEE